MLSQISQPLQPLWPEPLNQPFWCCQLHKTNKPQSHSADSKSSDHEHKHRPKKVNYKKWLTEGLNSSKHENLMVNPSHPRLNILHSRNRNKITQEHYNTPKQHNCTNCILEQCEETYDMLIR